MRLKSKTPKRSRWRLSCSQILHTIFRFKMIGIGFLLVLVGLVYFGQKRHQLLERLVRKSHLISNVIQGQLSQPDVLDIDIGFENYQRLLYLRNKALTHGQITPDTKRYVPATIRHGNAEYATKIRFKGNWLDHLKEKKWSFKVRLKGEATLFGMKYFSLQSPYVRHHICEWIFHKAMAREDVLSLRYKFVQVKVNGENWGIYALEEGFEKRLVEFRKRREGPILSLDDFLFYNPLTTKKGRKVYIPSRVDEEQNSRVRAYDTKRIFADPTLKKNFLLAQELLMQFRKGTLSVASVFDSDRVAKYIALSELLGLTESVVDWRDAKYYFNPITAKLEPIAYEGGLLRTIIGLEGGNRQIGPTGSAFLFDRLFSDAEFFRKYLSHLERFSNPRYLDALERDLAVELNRNLHILYKDKPNLWFRYDQFRANAAFINHALNPTAALHAYLNEESPKSLTLSLANIQFLPLEILQVLDRNGNPLTQQKSTILSPPSNYKVPKYTKLSFKKLKNSQEPYQVVYRLLGAKKSRTQSILPWPVSNQKLIPPHDLVDHKNFWDRSLLTLDEEKRELRMAKKVTHLSQPLVIPSGFRFVLREGEQITLSKGAYIVSHSPVQFIGSPQKPILIESRQQGQGIAVVNAEGASLIKHVKLKNLEAPRAGGWELTGALTFYESPVTLEHLHSEGTQAEDALNLFRSPFTLSKSYFSHSTSDAIDVDFSEGTLSELVFKGIGNDAIDVSGSNVTITQVRIDGAGDKAISAGEKSRLRASHIEVRDCLVGVASKDGSQVILEQSAFSGCKVGYAVYRKKPEFNGAKLQVSYSTLRMIETPYLVERHSVLSLDGKSYEYKHRSVLDKIYPPQKPLS